MSSHMITDGTTSWVWTDASSAMPAEGMKMSFVASSTAMEGSKAQPQGVDPNQPMNYSCSGWTADGSEFILPASVTFTDMSAMMQGATASGVGMKAGASAGAGAAGNSAMCSACNQAPNATQKAQCLAALGCK